MNPRIAKLKEERDKLFEKATAYQARIKAIEEQIMKLENTDIVGMVREFGLTPESLAELLKGIRKSPVETFKNNTEKTEDESDENN